MKTKRLFIVNFIMKLSPSTRFFGFKRSLLRWAGGEIGKNVRCASNTVFLLGGELSIGHDTWIGHDGLLIGGRSSVFIGANCDIGPRVNFVCGSHRLNLQGPHVAGESYSLPISIGDGCWIGVGATILGGTTIGKLSVVAAGAVVKGNFPGGCLIGGIPAKVLRASLDELAAD